MLLVVDSSVTEEVTERTHEIIVGGELIPVTFKHGEDTILPFEQGVKFMSDGFTVTECDGLELALPAVASDNVAAQISSDECIAKYTELNINSLKLRAAQKEGGEIYLDADDADREDIIAFIVGDAPVAESEDAPLEEDSLIDEDEFEVDPDPDTPEKMSHAIVQHFGHGNANIAFRILGERGDGVAVYGVIIGTEVGAKEELIVQGTLLELNEAVLKGISADRYNSDTAAVQHVDPAAPEEASDEEKNSLGGSGALENPDDKDGDGVDDALQARIAAVMTFFGGKDLRPVDTEANGATIFEVVTETPEKNVHGSLHDLEIMMEQRQEQVKEPEEPAPETEPSSVSEEKPNPETSTGEGSDEDKATPVT